MASIEHNMNKSDFALSSRTKVFTLGAMDVDRRLGPGLQRGALHELHADDDDVAAAIGFGFMLAWRSAPGKPIVLVRDDRCVHAFGRLSGDGVADLGGDPARLVVVHAADALATLRAAADAIDCADVGAVIVEPWRASPVFDLTASRRLALRAERSNVLTLAVRTGVDPAPSAATTRWQIRSAPSTPLAADAPGYPAFVISLLRHRGGVAGFDARVEWNRDWQSFSDAPQRGDIPAVAAVRTRNPDVRRAA